MRVLEAGTKLVDNSLVLDNQRGIGYRIVSRGGLVVCDDGDDTYSRAAKFAVDARNLRNKAVAWIGGGLCVGPRVFRISPCAQTVYEMEPALAEFCPNDCTFVPGDWRVTLTGTYDIIVYDLGDKPDMDLLNLHLNPGGLILGVE